MTAAWPGTLPAAPKYGFAEKRQTNIAFFAPDVGPPKMRRRSTAVCVVCTANFEMTDAQLVDFNTFFETTLADGTLPYTWNHPRTGVSYTWAFSPSEAPTVTAITYRFNQVDCSILRLPP